MKTQKQNRRDTIIKSLAFIGACFAWIALIAVAPLVRSGVIAENQPKGNATYYNLLHLSKITMSRMGLWKLEPINSDVQLVGLTQDEAFGPIRTQNFSPHLIERIYLPPLTDKSNKLFSVEMSGECSSGDSPIMLSPAQDLRYEYEESHIRYWTSTHPRKLQEGTPESNLGSWKFIATRATDSNPLDTVLLRPSPDYQVEIFADGKRTGLMAAWQRKDASVVTLTFKQDDGSVSHPIEITTKDVTIAAHDRNTGD